MLPQPLLDLAKRWRKNPCWLVATLALALTGCKTYQTVGGQANPHPVKTAVSLSPSTTELALIEFTITLVGRTASDDFPPSAASVPIVMSGTKPDVEAIKRASPDIVLYDPLLIGQSDIDKLKQLGLKTQAIGGNTLDDSIKSLYQAASATGSETMVNDYVNNQIRKELNKQQMACANRSLKVAIVMPGSNSEHMIDGTKSFLADLIRQLHSTPVGPDTSSFVNLNAEQLVRDNPDVIIVAGDPNLLAKDPRLQNMSAFKRGNVFGLKPDLLLRQGSRMDQMIDDVGSALTRAK